MKLFVEVTTSTLLAASKEDISPVGMPIEKWGLSVDKWELSPLELDAPPALTPTSLGSKSSSSTIFDDGAVVTYKIETCYAENGVEILPYSRRRFQLQDEVP